MRFEHTTLLHAPPDAVWSLVSDTDRLDRNTGFPPAQFDLVPQDGGGTATFARARLAGLLLEYQEEPFEWIRPEYYAVRRIYTKGPLKQITIRVDLKEEGGDTRLTFAADVALRSLPEVAGRLVSRKVSGLLRVVCSQFEAYWQGLVPNPFPERGLRPEVNRARLDQLTEAAAVAGVNRNFLHRLEEYILRSPDQDLLAIRPFDLANTWGLDRMQTLRACLTAARIGLLDLRWRILCRFCRGGQANAASLREIGSGVHCPSCNIRFDGTFDQSVEVCFTIPVSVRKVSGTHYCLNGPGVAPHARAQLVIPPGTRGLSLNLTPGRYLGRSLQLTGEFNVNISDSGAEQVRVRIEEEATGGVRAFIDNECIRPSAQWLFENHGSRKVVLRLETPDWSPEVATAALVTSLQEFRDQFSSEVLSPGVEMAVQRVALLFTDLEGSTAMYRKEGDAPSYRAVREHFQRLRSIIAKHDGAVIKTIGDAVMAGFSDPLSSLRAAVEVQRNRPDDKGILRLKIGLNWGPALAVNANGTLDYFGHTVNLAARFQRVSRSGEITIPAELGNDPVVREYLSQEGLRQELLRTPIRGLEEKLEVIRLSVEPMVEKQPQIKAAPLSGSPA